MEEGGVEFRAEQEATLLVPAERGELGLGNREWGSAGSELFDVRGQPVAGVSPIPDLPIHHSLDNVPRERLQVPRRVGELQNA
jgi:hypothetical protein